MKIINLEIKDIINSNKADSRSKGILVLDVFKNTLNEIIKHKDIDFRINLDFKDVLLVKNSFLRNCIYEIHILLTKYDNINYAVINRENEYITNLIEQSIIEAVDKACEKFYIEKEVDRLKNGSNFIYLEKLNAVFYLPNSELEHKLHYSDKELDETEKLIVASIMNAYRHLLFSTQKELINYHREINKILKEYYKKQ